MKKLLTVLLIFQLLTLSAYLCHGQNPSQQNVRPTIILQSSNPLSLSDIVKLITPDLDYYWQYGTTYPGDTPLVLHRKITEMQYQEVLSDINLQSMKNMQGKDNVVFSQCEGVNDSSSGTIIISTSEYQITYEGKCTFPRGFDHFYTFLRENAPRFKRHSLVLTRKSSKIWEQVKEMPAVQ